MNRRSNRRSQIVTLYELATLVARRDPGDTKRGRTRDSKIAPLDAELTDTPRLPLGHGPDRHEKGPAVTAARVPGRPGHTLAGSHTYVGPLNVDGIDAASFTEGPDQFAEVAGLAAADPGQLRDLATGSITASSPTSEASWLAQHIVAIWQQRPIPAEAADHRPARRVHPRAASIVFDCPTHQDAGDDSW
jgi:hypothetical protein